MMQSEVQMQSRHSAVLTKVLRALHLLRVNKRKLTGGPGSPGLPGGPSFPCQKTNQRIFKHVCESGNVYRELPRANVIPEMTPHL